VGRTSRPVFLVEVSQPLLGAAICGATLCTFNPGTQKHGAVVLASDRKMMHSRLIDDATIPGRWHLGEVFESDRIRNDLSVGHQVVTSESLTCWITHNGMPLDFCLTSFGVPVATTRLAQVISLKAGSDLQRLTVQIATQAQVRVTSFWVWAR
jgi:hypothetical protein